MSPRRALDVLLLIPFVAVHLAAQNVLMANHDGKAAWVRTARGLKPWAEVDGKLQEITTSGYVLKAVPEFFPVFVSVNNIEVKSSALQMSNGGTMNNTFEFYATFVSSYRLKDVFLVLYLETETGNKSIFMSEVGELAPNEERSVSAGVPLDSEMGSGKYQLHIFSEGFEVLQSLIPFDKREQALDRMVAARVKGVHAAAPKFFIGPKPVYPRALKKEKGQAMVAVHIGANGAVTDPVVTSATDPAFGDSAVTAVRMWRFLPAVKDDIPVSMNVVIPFIFDPPMPSKG